MSLAQAIILAAGRGERMRPLTDRTPKPLLEVRGKPLLQWHLDALARAGMNGAAINTAWLGEEIPGKFGGRYELPTVVDAASAGGHTDGLRLDYSMEGVDFGGALETAGGIVRALPMLADVFWVVAGDVFAPDFAFTTASAEQFARGGKLAHLWLVPNPTHHPNGDFGLTADGLVLSHADVQYTYSTIGLYRKEIFARPYCDIESGNPTGVKAVLAPILRRAMRDERISGELYLGKWMDIGTPGRLAEINREPHN